jgi:hypothetical protein
METLTHLASTRSKDRQKVRKGDLEVDRRLDLGVRHRMELEVEAETAERRVVSVGAQSPVEQEDRRDHLGQC